MEPCFCSCSRLYIDFNELQAIFVGTKESGKSSLILRFKNSEAENEIKPTIALDYTFSRFEFAIRSWKFFRFTDVESSCFFVTFSRNKSGGGKDLTHIWEVGSGLSMANLLNVPLHESSVRSAVVIIVLDLSK
jgi:hypothetical protein